MFNIILYSFQMNSKMIKKSCTLESGSPNASSTHLVCTYHDVIDYIPHPVISQKQKLKKITSFDIKINM